MIYYLTTVVYYLAIVGNRANFRKFYWYIHKYIFFFDLMTYKSFNSISSNKVSLRSSLIRLLKNSRWTNSSLSNRRTLWNNIKLNTTVITEFFFFFLWKTVCNNRISYWWKMTFILVHDRRFMHCIINSTAWKHFIHDLITFRI